ncbi:hypothetical protein MNBD_GAMMA23-359 [hydrothermal vent metagenome]|uniref:Glycosyltransferase n=1 Tax=hydrothermal vent metagenome TaxID=652676 RepID=A0A3B0ZUA2_9ZZZZ
MRFCMVSTFYPPYHFGGDATYVRALSRALVSRGHEVDIIHCEDAYRTVSHTKNVPELLEEDGIKVHRLKSRFGVLSPLYTQQTGRPGFKSAAIREILKQNFDVVNFHNISLVGGPAVLGLSEAAVTLYTLHEHWLLCPAHIFWKNKMQACDKRQCMRCSIRSGIPPQLWRYTGLIKRSLRHVDALIAPSKFTAEKHQQAGIADNIEVLPLFSTLNPEQDRATRVTSSQPAVRQPFIYVGRVTASKGIVALLDVFSKLPAIDLHVIGDGDLLVVLKRDYRKFANIQFLGAINQSELIQIYQSAKALILPSLAPETFGLTIVEASACRTPALVRSAGGSRDIVDSTGGGFVYQTDDELISYIMQLDSEAGLSDMLGEKARRGFENFYTEEQHLNTYLTLVDNIQNKKTATAKGFQK